MKKPKSSDLLLRTVGSLILACVCAIQPALAESALLTKVRAGDDVKVVLLGTSLTDNGTWPASLQSWMSAESPGPGTVTVVNRAASGQASDHGLAVQTPTALTDNPDAVFLEFSMNDAATSKNITLQQAEDNLDAMLDQFVAQNPNIIIVLQTMNNLPPDTSPFSPRTDLNGYYQIYRDVAAERSAILIDHYPNWLDLYTNDLPTWNSYMTDAVHPNALGQDTVLMPELQEVLGPPSEPPAGDFLAAWDAWGDSSTPYASDAIASGFSASVATATNRINGSFGSTDGDFGALPGAATSLGGLLVRESGGNLTVTIQITNNTGEPWSIDSLHFDFGVRTLSPNSFTLTYTSGGLGNPGTQIDSQSGLPILVGSSQGAGEGDYADFDYNLAGTLGDTILDDGESATFTLAFSGQSSATASSIVDNVAFQGAPVAAEVVPRFREFTYDPVTGNCVVSIEGAGSTTYKLVEAGDLDFSNPDQDPVPLSSASVGTLDGDGVTTTAGGDATIHFNLGTTKSATFLRAEEIP